MRVVGYGVTESGGIPTTLQTANIKVLGRIRCEAAFTAVLGPGPWIDSTMICIRAGRAGAENVPTICSGDSGGPWTMRRSGEQAGITSWALQGSGTGCDSCLCCPGYPQVGVNLAVFTSWINGYIMAWKVEN